MSAKRKQTPMTRVVIESPFAGDVERNMTYASEAAYASHLFFTQVLDDLNPDERQLGIEAGLEWGKAAEKTVVYIDYGISSGMKLGIKAAEEAERKIEYRRIK